MLTQYQGGKKQLLPRINSTQLPTFLNGKFTPRSLRAVFREMASVSLLNRVSRRKALLPNMAARLWFEKLHLNKP